MDTQPVTSGLRDVALADDAQSIFPIFLQLSQVEMLGKVWTDFFL